MQANLQSVIQLMHSGINHQVVLSTRSLIANNPDYAWYFKLTQLDTQSRISQRLEQLLVRGVAHDPGHYETHFDEAGAAIERCITRNREIHDLESAALTTVIAYLTEEQLQPGALELAKTELKSWRMQLENKDPADDIKILGEHDQITTSARALRKSFHTVKGHALNYLQRVEFLRELQARDVCVILERLQCARLGIAAAFNYQLPSLPEWSSTGDDPLEDLVGWCRDAIRNIENLRRRETVRTRLIYLDSTASNLLDEIRQNKLNAEGFHWGVFNLKRQHLGLNEHQHCRLLGLNFGMQFSNKTSTQMLNAASNHQAAEEFNTQQNIVRDWRSRFCFSAEVDLPAQFFDINDNAQRFWRREPVQMYDSVRVINTCNPDDHAIPSIAHVHNACPLGEWVIRVHKNCRNGDGDVESVRGLLYDQQSTDRKKINKFQLLDFWRPVLLLRIAVSGG